MAMPEHPQESPVTEQMSSDADDKLRNEEAVTEESNEEKEDSNKKAADEKLDEDKPCFEVEGKEEEEKPKKPKVDPKNWPLKGIKEPGDNDVLFGRGGGTNHAKGNKRYRKMVEDRKLEYVNSKRLDKPLVALEIIRIWRAQDPPGRFLKQDANGMWSDVGDKKAREKTSQALREKAPLIRKQQEEERLGKEGGGDQKSGDEKEEGNEQSTKTTRFAEGTTTESKGGVKKAVLARDHSLGREYLQAGETMNLEGFSWREGSLVSIAPPPGDYPSRRISSGSMGMPPPSDFAPRVPSIGPPPPPMGGPPPAQGFYHRTPTDEFQRQAFQNPPMMPGYSGYGPHHRSGSWTHNAAHAMPPLREHSLSQNPLRNASVGHAAPLNAFVDAGRSGSGYWGDPSMRPPPPPPASNPYAGPYRDGAGPYPTYNSQGGPSNMMQPPPPVTAAPPYSVDPAIAKTWSSHSDDDISKMVDRDLRGRETMQQPQTYQQPVFGREGQGNSQFPRPSIIKRMTSNQNETIETKKDLVGPSVKRAALNRDNSLAANRLKAESLPEYYNKNGKFDPDREMNNLTDNLEQSTLGNEKPEPRALGASERTSTLDNIALDLMTKPSAINAGSRASTVDALSLEGLESDPIISPGDEKSDNTTSALPKPSALSTTNRMSTMEACFADLETVTAKPLALTGTDRVSTSDYLDLGDAPLTEIDIDNMYENGD